MAGLVTAAALLVAGGLAVAGSASAAPVPQTGNGHLVLTADPFPLGTHDMAPGGAVRWQISAEMDEVGTADLFLSVSGHGVMAQDPTGMTLDVEWCPVAWSVPSDVTIPATCPGGGSMTKLATAAIGSIPGGNLRLGTLARGVPSHLLVTAALPLAAGSRFVNDRGDVTLSFQAAGDTESVSIGSGHLASTGSMIAGPALLAAGLLLSGALLARIRGRRRVLPAEVPA